MKASLEIGDLQLPVKLYAAVEDRGVHFRLLHAADLPAHSLWSGSISFGLVTVPVELYAARRRAGVSLRMLGPDDTPLAREYVCPEDGKVVSGDEIERGYEVAPRTSS